MPPKTEKPDYEANRRAYDEGRSDRKADIPYDDKKYPTGSYHKDEAHDNYYSGHIDGADD